MTASQRKHTQIEKEAPSIAFALRKFHQYLYARNFILVTDHKPLLSLFHPNKATPALEANRLATWAFILTQYNYTIEYRKTSAHGNADALSHLPVGNDQQFNEEEGKDDSNIVNAIKTLSTQLKPTNPESVRKESAKDPVISV